MTNLNKYIFLLCVFSNYNSQTAFVVFLFIFNVSFLLFTCRGIEFDHVKLSIVHKFFHIQGIGINPLKQFKDVLPTDVYKKCENKSRKT
jgi:hypothetical protein